MRIHKPEHISEQRPQMKPQGSEMLFAELCHGVEMTPGVLYRTQLQKATAEVLILLRREQWAFSRHDSSTLIQVNFSPKGLISLFGLER